MLLCCQIESKDKKYSLTIPSATLEDEAEYSVKCGEQQTTAMLFVEGKLLSHVTALLYTCRG